MGYKHTPWAWEITNLNPTEKLVLLCLTNHANNSTQKTWVSIGTIARECGFAPTSRNSIRRALQVLRASGYISYEDQPSGQGMKQPSNTYTVNWHLAGAQSTGGRVLTAPPPGAQSTTNEELNEELSNEEPVRPSTPSKRSVSPSTQASSAATAEASDPVSPEFHNSTSRKELLTAIRNYAEATNAENKEQRLYVFESALYQHVSKEHPWEHYLNDMGWTPPRKCSNRYEAGVWLNQLLHHVRNEEGPYEWPTLTAQ